jgi:hypothetical protein
MRMTTQTTDKASAREVEPNPPVTPEDIETVKTDPRFDLPTRKVTTAEDAVQAYLRGEITEGELRTVCAAYGYNIPTFVTPMIESVDNAYENKIPEDLLIPAATLAPLEDRLKEVEERDKNAEKATKAAEDAKVDPSLDPTVKGNIENKEAAKALEDTKTKDSTSTKSDSTSTSSTKSDSTSK